MSILRPQVRGGGAAGARSQRETQYLGRLLEELRGHPLTLHFLPWFIVVEIWGYPLGRDPIWGLSFGRVSAKFRRVEFQVFCETSDFLKLPRRVSGMRVSVCISFRRGSFGSGSFWLDKFRVPGVGEAAAGGGGRGGGGITPKVFTKGRPRRSPY